MERTAFSNGHDQQENNLLFQRKGKADETIDRLQTMTGCLSPIEFSKRKRAEIAVDDSLMLENVGFNSNQEIF